MEINNPINQFLEDLVEELQVPISGYEQAEQSYKSLGSWLHRLESTVRDGNPDVYVQGSFQLGTAIKPASEEEDYDIDMVCRLDYEHWSLSQAELKRQVGIEISAYAKRHNMGKPKDGRRCWTLIYAVGAQFHMDVLPAVPDIERKQYLFEAGPELARLGETALSITDKEHPKYFHQGASEWPRSNPKGFALWFRDRMGNVFTSRAIEEAKRLEENVEDLPTYRVQTPLQGAIQLLKRHRDLMFCDRGDDKPISILITTLAAKSYNQEEELSNALFSILQDMDGHIIMQNGVAWVENPADPEENFADKWVEFPERQDAFYEWLNQARTDFELALGALNSDYAGTVLTENMGAALVSRALGRRDATKTFRFPAPLVEASESLILTPDYMLKPRWPHAPEGEVFICDATFTKKGFRTQSLSSGCPVLPKNGKLLFKAVTSITGRFKVYWQVVNTGAEAEAADGLRGGFSHVPVNGNSFTNTESTLYRGRHSIECFIVRNGKLAARSGQFIVNIN